MGGGGVNLNLIPMCHKILSIFVMREFLLFSSFTPLIGVMS